nr:uncharacterized mitochondrial protein AtMg00810-like [Tanacetum cinerariifolium]
MIDYLSIVETNKVIHTMETDMLKLVVEIECFGMSFDEFDKETGSSDGLQPMQVGLSYVHALNEPHLHEIHVVPSKHEADQSLVSFDGLGRYDWSDQVYEGPNYALMAFSSSSSNSEKYKLMVLGYKTGLKSVEERLEFYKTNESIYLEDIKALKVEIKIGEIAIRELRKKLEIAQREKNGIQLKVDKFEHASKNLNKLIDCQIVDNYKKGLGYENHNAVPPPYTGNFMPLTPNLSFTGLDEFVNKPVVKSCKAKSSKEEPKVVRKNDDALIIKEWVLDNEEEDVSQPKVVKKIVRHSIAKIEPKAVVNAANGNNSNVVKALAYYEEIDGGYVAFGGNIKRKKITRKGSGPDWLFDIDALTRTMNYEPIVTGDRPVKDYILLPSWTVDPPFSQDPKSSHDDGSKPLSDNGKKVDEDPRKENKCKDQEKEDNINSTNNVNIVSSTVNATDTNEDNKLPFDPNMLALEDVSIFNFSSDDEDDGTAADMNNLDTTIKKEDGIFISQDKYVAEILKKFEFIEVKTASTPMETHKPMLKDEDGEEVDVYMYRSMIGSLMYLTSSRPDIMFAVCACTRYQVNPKVSHLHVVKRIFRYLKCQPRLGLLYPKDSYFDLVAYSDIDYARASLDRKSTAG